MTWLREHPAAPHTSVITSLPDVSELSQLGFDGWRRWFIDAAAAVLAWVPPDEFAIFYQSDVLHDGAWVDKGHLVSLAADAVQARLAWHKIVCRHAPGTPSWGRASYAHVLCFTRGEVPMLRKPSPHVLPEEGDKTWTRGMGRAACQLACSYLQAHAATRCIVDPFCGHGSVLAVGLELGFDVIGVELSAKRCRTARALLGRIQQSG
ncbi:MAG: SAM-dependent methyltransferase [Polyangiales bacterium]